MEIWLTIFILWLIQVEVRIFISVLVAPLNTRRGLVTGAPITQIPLFLLYPAGRFGPATQLWFDFKFGSACSTLSVGRDSRRVKKSHKERTVGRDSLSPFFFQSFSVRSSRPTESLEQANFCLMIWCEVRFRTQDHLNQNNVCFVDGNLRFKCRELHILYSTLCKRGRVPADWTSAASRNSGSWEFGREACSPDFSSVNVSSVLRMSRSCSMWGVSGGSSLQNLMIGLEGVGFKYWGWVWSGDVTVSFREVVAALESRSPWSTGNKSSPSHWGHFQSWL